MKKKPTRSDDVTRAITLAKALNTIDDAYRELDSVFFNPSGYLELRDEIRDKIVELLAGVEP